MITKSMIISTLIAFFITVLLSPTLIKFLQKLKFGQVIRDLGPEDHLKKKGTPTMGGIIFIFAIAVVSLIYMKENPEISSNPFYAACEGTRGPRIQSSPAPKEANTATPCTQECWRLSRRKNQKPKVLP